MTIVFWDGIIQNMKKIKVNLKSDSYFVYAGYPLEKIGEKLSDKKFGKKVLLLTDKNVSAIYGNKVVQSLKKLAKKEVTLFEIKPGEESKTFENTYKIICECSDFKMERIDTVLTLGGGVVSDIGGFAASIYLRGINFVACPTSLLAQVDASVGGKTGVDLPWGKNLVGSFYQPSFVYMDIKTLDTLPEREIKQGIAEVIKCGMIKSKTLFDFLGKFDFEKIEKKYRYIVEESVKIKRVVVEKDEEEKGLREILNFGHTFGHAVEITYLPKYTHGEAVSLGMVGETFLSWKLGFCKKETLDSLIKILKKYNLPYNMKEIKIRKVLSVMKYDKKVRQGKLRFVFPERIGKVKRGVEVTPEYILKKWKEWGNYGR